MVTTGLGDRSIGDADSELISAVFDMSAMALEQLRKNRSSERSRQIGFDLLSGSRDMPLEHMRVADAERTLSGRDLWVFRLTHADDYPSVVREEL